MSEPENEETSFQGGFDKEIELINSKYFCSLCACSFGTKKLFDIHLVEHMDKNTVRISRNRENFMEYIKIVCPACGKKFQITSDFALHFFKDCYVPPHTCMHCNEDLHGTPNVITHLIKRHNYTGQMLHEAGFLMNGSYNLTGSFMTQLSVSENSETPLDLSNRINNTTFDIVSESYPIIQHPEINDSSRDVINNSENSITIDEFQYSNPDINYSENSITINEHEYSNRDVNGSQNFASTYSSTVTGEPSTYHRATMQAFYVNPGSRIWRKVQSMGKFGNLKSHVIKKRKLRKKKIIAKSKFAFQQSSCSRAMLKSSIANVDISFLKDIKLKCSLKDGKILVSKRMKIMKKSKIAQDYEASDHQHKNSKAMLNSSIQNVDLSFIKDIKLKSSLKDGRTLVSKRMKIMKKRKTAPDYEISDHKSNCSRATSNSSTDNVDMSIFKDIKLKSSLKEARSIVAKRMEMNKNRNIDNMDVAQDHTNLKKTRKARNRTRKSKYFKKKPKSLRVRFFVCQLCNKSFKDSYKLRRHSFIHTGERPYTCSKCKKTFARDDHLKRHFKRVCSQVEDSK